MNVCISRSVLGLSLAALLFGCSTVELSPAGEKVRLLEQQEIGKCRYVGKVAASVTDRIGILAREDEVVKKEVEINARNAAGNMGGDSIVSASPLTDGRQSFDVYRCINP